MLKKCVETAQNHGLQLWAQLSHPERQCPISVTYFPVALSAIPAVNKILPVFSK